MPVSDGCIQHCGHMNWKCRLRGSSSALAIVVLFFATGIDARSSEAPQAFQVRPGVVIDSIPCARHPNNSYALYLPSAYTPQRKWPIIYAFDPGARGDVPVRLYKDVAEKYGYIIAGSNDSQNFEGQAAAAGTQAMLEDALRRFSVDLDRIYTTGFSGGARMATLIAVQCSQSRSCGIAGVVASGATYPAGVAPAASDSFLYFIGLGDTDFNYPEIVQTRLAKERLGSPYRLRTFPGPHQWSPASVFEEAVAWFQLRAMQAGKAPRDETFIREQHEKALAEIAQAESSHDALRQFFAYRALMEDFKGLVNAPEVESKLHPLQRSPDLKRVLEKERNDAEEQERLTRDTSMLVARLSSAALTFQAQAEAKEAIVSNMARLRHSGLTGKDPAKGKIAQRAFNALFAQIVEEGQRRQAKRQYSDALPFYQILLEAAPDRAWPSLLLAETQLALGDKKRALKSVHRAADTGRIDAQVLEKDAALAPLFADPGFQAIVNRLKNQPPSARP